MTTEWLGHRDLCPVQWQKPCSCPCPSCGEPLDEAAPSQCAPLYRAWHQPPVAIPAPLEQPWEKTLAPDETED